VGAGQRIGQVIQRQFFLAVQQPDLEGDGDKKYR